MRSALSAEFPAFKSEEELKSAIETICARFGQIKAFRIFPASQTRPDVPSCCLCLLQLHTSDAENVLRATHDDIFEYGNWLAFLADVDHGYSAG